MTSQEFKNEFDILYNNIGSNVAPGIDPYETSVFLTQAQEEIVKNYFNEKGNKYQEGFADSSKRDLDLSRLVTTSDITGNVATTNLIKLDPRSVFYQIPSDVLFVLNERIAINDGDKIKNVVPVALNQHEYDRLSSRPFNEPLKRQCWKMIRQNNTGEFTGISEIITKSNTSVNEYVIRYVKRPQPIIVENLDAGLSIHGISLETECELNDSIHIEILKRAVELAKLAFEVQSLEANVQLNQRAE